MNLISYGKVISGVGTRRWRTVSVSNMQVIVTLTSWTVTEVWLE